MSILLKAEQVAERLNCPVHAVYRCTREKRYPFVVQISPGRYRFDSDRLEEFIKNGGVKKDECQNAKS